MINGILSNFKNQKIEFIKNFKHIRTETYKYEMKKIYAYKNGSEILMKCTKPVLIYIACCLELTINPRDTKAKIIENILLC